MDAIFERASVRAYAADPVTDEQVERLLRAAMAAPSACNQQPWAFYVVRDPAKLLQLSTTTPYAGPTAAAPCCIVVCGARDVTAPSYVVQDLAAATQNILLEAVGLGLGCCWQGVAPVRDRMDAVRGVLGVDAALDPFCLISVGHPAEGAVTPRGAARYNPDRVHWVG